MTKTLLIDFKTLKEQFEAMFKPPLIQEVYYHVFPEGWCIQFFKNGYYIKCNISREEVVDGYRKDNAVTDPIQLRGAIGAFEAYYLKYAIEVKEEKSDDIGVKKERTYITDPSEAPEGASVKRGKRGGLYYDSDPKKPHKKEEPNKHPTDKDVDPSNIKGILEDYFSQRYKKSSLHYKQSIKPALDDFYNDIFNMDMLSPESRLKLIHHISWKINNSDKYQGLDDWERDAFQTIQWDLLNYYSKEEVDNDS